MKCVVQQNQVQYLSRRIYAGSLEAEFVANYEPCEKGRIAEQGSLEYWLTERYCLYTKNKSGAVCRAEIHHAPWPLQRANAEIETNSMTDALGISLPQTAPLLHFSKLQEVAVWPLREI
jgi:uncharacterized protein YqjF (DUF2071 family)